MSNSTGVSKSTETIAPESALAAAFSRMTYPVLASQAGSQSDVRGHAAGYAAGLQRAQDELGVLRAELEFEFASRSEHLEQRYAGALASVTAAAQALDARVTPVLAELDASLVTAALELAEAVLGYEVRADRAGRRDAGARAAIARVLTAAGSAPVVAVRLNPADAAMLDAEALGVTIVADPSLAPGDAVADLPDGLLDGRLATALSRARAVLSHPSAFAPVRPVEVDDAVVLAADDGSAAA